MKTMKDYHNLHLKCDIFLLADWFEKVRNSLKSYGLFPSHYLSAPGLIWDTILKMTNLSLNLLQILTCLYSFKNIGETEFFVFQIDIAKAIISI